MTQVGDLALQYAKDGNEEALRTLVESQFASLRRAEALNMLYINEIRNLKALREKDFKSLRPPPRTTEIREPPPRERNTKPSVEIRKKESAVLVKTTLSSRITDAI